MTDDRFDERFDELMRDAARTYRRPPEAPLDDMWASVEAQLPATHPVLETPVRSGRGAFRSPNWYAVAATLIIGIGIGRATLAFSHAPARTPVVAVAAAPVPRTAPVRSDAISGPYELETSRYLGQAAALLIALPSETRGGKVADEQFLSRAGQLLTTTRMLIDSPAATDPTMRTLFEDLELVLAQVVRLQENHDRTELDLINRALEQRDVIPRLRTAVADISAD
ncbi:MAG TPA: hypothetical protein VHV78_06815 [Gemmatimonadaceae bacterium]|jgi:hypothetical protein|nr:hypothetical protein [Gemmatimonadaceae bacterium]